MTIKGGLNISRSVRSSQKASDSLTSIQERSMTPNESTKSWERKPISSKGKTYVTSLLMRRRYRMKTWTITKITWNTNGLRRRGCIWRGMKAACSTSLSRWIRIRESRRWWSSPRYSQYVPVLIGNTITLTYSTTAAKTSLHNWSHKIHACEKWTPKNWFRTYHTIIQEFTTYSWRVRRRISTFGSKKSSSWTSSKRIAGS